MTVTAGYDIGGAHLKIALVDNTSVLDVLEIACPLWQGLDQIDIALNAVAHVTAAAGRHSITMTGELTEIFKSRAEGVAALTGRAALKLGPGMQVFAGLEGFVAASESQSRAASIGSANFLASARVIAGIRARTLLIDLGSTTTDIIPCDRPQGLTDAERLQTGELVYTGYSRTPVPSVTTVAPLAGRWQTLARDGFATMEDVRRVIGRLAHSAALATAHEDDADALGDSIVRLSRGFGLDGLMSDIQVWRAAASFIEEAQMRSILDGALQVMSAPGRHIEGVVTAGVGAPFAAEAARRLGLPSVTFGDLIGARAPISAMATQCAPAVAVALLAARST